MTNRARLQPLQRVRTSLVSPTYLLHGLSPNLTLENAREIDVVDPNVHLADLEPNKRYYFRVVDAKHLPLSETAEFVSGGFVSLNTKNSTSSSVTLSLEGLRGLGLSFYNKQLSHLLTSAAKTPKALTLPMLFEYRSLTKDQTQPWQQRQLFIEPNTDSFTFTIDNLAPNRTYEYRLLALNPLKSNFRLFQSLLDSQAAQPPAKSLQELFERVTLRFLDYFYFRKLNDRLLILSTFEEELLQEDLNSLLAPLRQQHFLSKEFAAQLQSSFAQAVVYSFEGVSPSLEALLEGQKTLAQKLLNFFLTHFSKTELESLLAQKPGALFKTQEEILKEALADSSLILLTHPNSSSSQTFKTSQTNTQLFASHDNVLLVLNQEVLKSLASQKTPPKITVVLHNHSLNTFQRQTLPLSQIPLLAKTSYIFFQINELREQFQKLSAEEQKAKFGVGLKQQIGELEESIAKH